MAPSKKVTKPVAALGVTVAVNVTLAPSVIVPDEEVIMVVVLGFTVCPPARLPLLLLKFLSMLT